METFNFFEDTAIFFAIPNFSGSAGEAIEVDVGLVGVFDIFPSGNSVSFHVFPFHIYYDCMHRLSFVKRYFYIYFAYYNVLIYNELDYVHEIYFVNIGLRGRAGYGVLCKLICSPYIDIIRLFW